MKKHVMSLVLAAGLISAQAQAIDLIEMITPTPVAVVIQISKWMKTQENPVYTVTVQSTAATETQARDEAFKLAVGEAIGSVLVSETEVSNGNLDRHEIINYSSGYVDDFEVLEKQAVPGGVQLTVKVNVRGSKIADRVFNKSTDTQSLEGDKKLESLRSLRHEHAQGDKLLSAVMVDYPTRAYDIDVKGIEYTTDPNRIVTMNVQFAVKWNHSYVESMHETVKTVGKRGVLQPSFSIKAAPGAAGWKRAWQFDYVRWRIVYDSIIASDPAVQVALMDSKGTIVHKGCYFYTELDLQSDYVIPTETMVQVNQDHLQVNTYNVLDATLDVLINDKDLKSLDKMNVKVVRKEQCY